MAIIKSTASATEWIIDTTSSAGRITPYDTSGAALGVSGNPLAFIPYAGSRSLAPQSKITYFASGTFTPAATPTDLVTIFGSASKTVRVVSMKIGTTNSAAGSQQFFLIRRSSANSSGTFVAATAIQADTSDAAATATLFGHYTGNPTLGSTVGTINTKRVASPIAIPASFAGVAQDAFTEMLDTGPWGGGVHKPIVLTGTAQGLVVNFNGAALVTGQTHCYQIIWIEE